MSPIKPLRATFTRWTYKVKTNSGEAVIESSGYIDPDLGEALRTLQIHITHLTEGERDTLLALTERVMDRVRKT